MGQADQVRVLQMIPAWPRKTTPGQIREKLLEEGLEFHERTVRRYLLDLCSTYPSIQCDDRTKPHSYCWAKGATPILPPTLDPQMALAFKLLQRYAASILPPVTLQHLEQYFAHADKALGSASDALRR